MKQTIHNILRGVLFIMLLALSSFSFEAEATVGGSTTIHTFTYNPQDESVYFIQEDGGGRGCPPELKKISLNTGEVSVVYSCDEGEELRQQNGSYESNPINEKINAITAGFKNLSQINLNDNNIAVDVDFVRDENFTSAEYQGLMRKHFAATVFQNNMKVAQFETVGCSNEQPFLYAGYAIPGFNKKIILLQSAVNDCFEGGYPFETLHVVGGVDNLNKEYYSNIMKDRSPLSVSEGTLVVFESEEVSESQPTPDNSDIIDPQEDGTQTDGINDDIVNENKSYFGIVTIVTSLLVVIVLGMIAGFLLKKRSY